ncbi:MAG: hypothetical protein IPM29_05270 [Planctomycetes bacterium]|nr:hypothetical protein [Planctomycetota bacterium]
MILAPADMSSRLDSLGFHAHDHAVHTAGAQVVTEVIVPEPELAWLRAQLPGALVQVVERSRPLRELLPPLPESPDPSYKTPQQIEQIFRSLEASYPAIAKVYDFQSRYGAPFTHGGRRIWLLRISDNPAVDEDEPSFVVCGNNHARELNSIEVPLRTATELCQGYGIDPGLTRIVDDSQIWIVASMNPDGLDAVWNVNQWWRKNRRDNGDGTFGVDLNRNYPFMWGQCGASTRTSSDTYQGPSAASEPETRCMIALADAEGLERLFDFHSYSRDVRPPHNPIVSAALPPMVSGYYGPWHAELAQLMSYATNTSCCCGTHMEWHHATRGTMAFLVEMGDAFQPPWPATLLEVDRVWPAVRRFLEKPVPLRGHVRSLRDHVPLDARITVAGQTFQHGQEIRSGGRFGRYHLWCAAGTWDVTFEAAGHLPRTLRVTTRTDATVELDVVLEPDLSVPVLVATGVPLVGSTVQLDLASPDDAGRAYFMPVSLLGPPPLPLGTRSIPITPDFLTALQLDAPGVFPNTAGTLDARGDARGGFVIPRDPGLVGVTFWFTALTLDPRWPFAVRGIGNAIQLTVR